MKNATMKAAVYEAYGPPEVVQIKEVAKPIPGKNELLIKMHATAVNSGDARMRRADPFIIRLVFGLFKPKKPILGVDISGVVEAVGHEVSKFQVGDEVFGSSFSSGMAAHAAYTVVHEDGVIAIKPKNLDTVDAASIHFGGNTALDFLVRGGIQKDQKVLIYGASGAVGVYAVQLAKYFGAEVYGVCSGRNVELVKSLGADRVFDYTKEDFAESNIQFDIIFDTVGKSPFSKCVKSLRPSGKYLRAVHMSLGAIMKGLWTTLTSKKKIIAGVAEETKDNLLFLRDRVEDGAIRPVIDRYYEFEDIAEAHRFVDTGRKRGSVVVKCL